MDALMELFRLMLEGDPGAWVLFGFASLAPMGMALFVYLIIKDHKERF